MPIDERWDQLSGLRTGMHSRVLDCRIGPHKLIRKTMSANRS